MKSASHDRRAIETGVARLRDSDAFARNVFDPEWGSFERDFDQVAKLLSGEDRTPFRALRVLRRYFSRRQVLMLSFFVSEKAFQDWRLLIRRRTAAEKPDGGQRERTRERECRARRVGMYVYGQMKNGISKADAIAAVSSELSLTVAEATIEKDLALFRRRARENGFVDPFAAVIAWINGGYFAEPELTVAGITRKGRPKKR
jgi:heme-degrading monooxygenase HmoA